MTNKDTSSLESFTSKQRWLLRILGILIGIGVGGFLVFQILFLSKVLPHGGL